MVSAIMPTANRSEYILNAIRCFLWQDFEDKELIILDNGSFPIKFLLPEDERIRYYRVPAASIGTLRNQACSLAKGDVIVHWDDDDWSAPNRISSQLKELGGYQVTAIRDLLYWHVGLQQPVTWNSVCRSEHSSAGYSLMYKRAWWMNNPFIDAATGEDGDFLKRAWNNRVFLRTENQGRMVSSLRDELYEREVIPMDRLPEGFFGVNFGK